MNIQNIQKIEQYAEKIYKYALMMLKNKEDAEDVMQETLYQYLSAKKEFINEKAESAWLYTVAINLCRNLRKNSWYKKRINLSEEDFRNLPDDKEVSINDHAELVEIIRKLPLKYSEVIVLYYYDEFSVPEISRLLGKNENTIYSLLSRGRKKLSEKLKGADYEEFKNGIRE